MKAERKKEYTATRNACKLCTPLGASLAFKGIEGAVPLLHGSQGCSTYIRRYLISHFKEPVDIASSNFSEETAVFGGGANLKIGLDNIRRQYQPQLIGIATTCLSETIGDDVPLILKNYREEHNGETLPEIVHVSTPSYSGTHADGFHTTVKAVVDTLTSKTFAGKTGFPGDVSDESFVNIFSGMVSPEDLRHLKEILSDFKTPYVMLPDYSERLDGGLWSEFQAIQEGGTPLEAIRKMGASRASIEFGRILAHEETAGQLLKQRFDTPLYSLGLPIGVNETDRFFAALQEITGLEMPEKYSKERDRLIDAYVDGHKYVSQVRAVVYGEEDLVVAMVSFLREIGIIPVLCASGGKSKHLKETIGQIVPEFETLGMMIRDNVDFLEIEADAQALSPDVLIGHSKGYSLARRLNIPLVRVGFPVHDRIGGSRILHVGYRGAQQLFDRIVNTLLEKRQETSTVGYSYM